MKRTEWPSEGDYVVVKIKRISNYGAVADLEEYNQTEGFIHISEVATSWVKNIRSFVSEAQIRVATVKRLDRAKNTIDLSLRDVTPQQEKVKLEEWKKEKRADKLFERVCKDLKQDFKKSYVEIAPKLEKKFGDLYSAFEQSTISGESAFDDVQISDSFKKAITSIAKDNISPPEVVIKGNLILSSLSGNGVETIKDALKKAEGKDIKLTYVSAPKYRIEVKAPDYDEAEKILAKATEAAISFIQKAGGEGSFERLKT